MRLLIHAEVDKLVSEWRQRAVEMRKESSPYGSTVVAGADSRAYSDALNDCADELETLNYNIEVGE